MDDKGLPVLNSKTYVKETAIALWETLPRQLLADILLIVVSLPALALFFLFNQPGLALLFAIISIGPGWVAFCALIARALLREPASPGEFFRAFARFFWRGTVLGLLFALPLVSAAWLLPALASPPVPMPVWLGLGGDIAGLFFFTVLSIYIYPQIVLYDAGVGVAFRNSLVLSARYLANTLGLAAMALLLVLLAVRVSFWLLAILPGLWMVFVINNSRMLLGIELGEPAGDE